MSAPRGAQALARARTLRRPARSAPRAATCDPGNISSRAAPWQAVHMSYRRLIRITFVHIAAVTVALSAGLADAEVVRVEFAARIKPGAECAPHSEPALAEAVAPPGSEVSGSFTYATNARSLAPNPVVYAAYDFEPDHFGLVLSVGPRGTFLQATPQRYTSAFISRAPAEDAKGKPFLQFTAIATGVPKGWPGDPGPVILHLELAPLHHADRLTALPSSLSLDRWRGSIILSGSRVIGGIPSWLICGEVTSLRSVTTEPRD